MTDERTSGPDFLCIGAQKGGTQWLYDQLASHPQFWMPPIKELHCLDLPAKQLEKARKILRKVGRNPEKYNARQREKHRPTVEARDVAFLEKLIDLPRIVDVDRYCSLFDGKGESITGDITPAYSALEPPTITRLAERLPDLKVVFIARDPVERLWSQYSMKIRKKQAPEVIGVDAVLAFASLPSIVSRSFPSRIVDHWRSFFPKEQVGLFFFDELRTDAAGIRKKILGFIGADIASQSGELSPGHNSKQRLKKYAMTNEVRAALCDYFAEEISLCAEHFGGPALGWGGRGKPSG